MTHLQIAIELHRNRSVFEDLLTGTPEDQYHWKPAPEKWCLLEVIGHLYDEERLDFRARVKHTLETVDQPMPSINPPGWVTEHQYMEQDFETRLQEFLTERDQSVKWLRSLENPNWDNTYQHPKLGPMPAQLFINNWLAHDYLHFRQITRLRYQYLKEQSTEALDYAGTW